MKRINYFKNGRAVLALALTFVSFTINAGQGPQPSICTRACWGARNGVCTSTFSTLSRAIVHHTAGAGDYTTANDPSKVRGVQNYHMDVNGWCDVGYHFLLNAGGYIYEARKNSMTGLPVGAHDACNASSFGFTVLGYYHPPYNQTFTAAARSSLEAVIAWRMPSSWSPYNSGTYCSRTVGTLDGHYKVVATACPGDVIIPQIPGIRDGVNTRKNPPPPAENLWSVATSRNLDGRMQIFARSPSGSMRTKWQTVEGPWSGWFDFGGQILGVPAAGTNYDGRIQVFARGTDNKLYTVWQAAPNGSFTTWFGMGGNCVTDPAVINNADGRMQVFTRASDNTLWSSWQGAPNGSFGGWIGMGGTCISVPAAGHNADGRIQIFARGGDNAVWTTWQTAPNGTFSGWMSMGGSCADAVGVGKNADGRLQLFTRATDNTVWSSWQSAVNGNFTGWFGMGGSCFSAPGVGRNQDGRMEVFTHAGNNTVWSIWQTAPNGAFTTGWFAMGGSCQAAPSVGYNADGRMELFTRATDNTVWSKWQTAPNGTWSDWLGIGN